MKTIALILILTNLPITLIGATFESTLEAMNESQIAEPIENKDIAAYRFTCIPTFNHPYSIKIIKTQKGYKMTRKVLSGKGGWEPGFIAESVSSEISVDTVTELNKMLAELKFSELVPDAEVRGLDGTIWVLKQ